MLRKLYLILIIALTGIISYGEESGDLYDEGYVKYKGIDVMNFYIPVEEKNKFYSSFDYEIKSDKNIYQWRMAEGYLEINQYWDFEFTVEKEYHRQKTGERRKYKGWDNSFSVVRGLNKSKYFNREWSNSAVFGLEQNQIDDKGFEIERYKIFAGYRMRTSLDMGKGGTYFGFDFLGKKVISTNKDGWSGELKIVSATNMGYGFQLFNTIYNEYIYFDTYKGTYRIGMESFLKWTYELSNNWAFSVTAGLDTDKYYKNTLDNYNVEAYLYPHLLFSYNISTKTRINGELGLPSYKITRDKAVGYKNFRDRGYFYTKIGIEYIF